MPETNALSTPTDFGKYVLFDRLHPGGMGGRQVVLRFPNSYGASIILSPFSRGYKEGLAEMAVLHFPDEEEDYNLVYDTPITDDVLGYLSTEDVKAACLQILALPERQS